jgi:enediyne biosynthesis protein E4
MGYAAGNSRGVVLVALAAPLIGAFAWPTFDDVSTAWRVSFRHHASPAPEKFLLERMGSGVAIFDANSDGLLDPYFVNGAKLDGPIQSAAAPRETSPDYWNRLFVQRAGNTFLDVTEKA